jgi:hypothetical protein
MWPLFGLLVVLILIVAYFVGTMIVESLDTEYGVSDYIGAAEKRKKQWERDAKSRHVNPMLKEKFSHVLRSCPTITSYDEIPNRLKYKAATLPESKRGIMHIGQLKLILSEIELLTSELADVDEKRYLLYAGSATGIRLPILANMFPGLKFILVDPRKHDFDAPDEEIKIFKEGADLQDVLSEVQNSSHRYFIIEDYFSNAMADTFSSLPDLIFFSDIRTMDSNEEVISDFVMLVNSAMQYNWVRRLNPKICMLKFRPPYFNDDDNASFGAHTDNPATTTASASATATAHSEIFDESKSLGGIDFIADYRAKKFRYLSADKLYLQAFPGLSSTESRLVVSRENVVSEDTTEYPLDLPTPTLSPMSMLTTTPTPLSSRYQKTQLYDCCEYEERFHYYNTVEREFGFHNTPINRGLGIDACGDCALMYRILSEYMQKYRPKMNAPQHIHHRIGEILKKLGRGLREAGTQHGKFFTSVYFEEHDAQPQLGANPL